MNIVFTEHAIFKLRLLRDHGFTITKEMVRGLSESQISQLRQNTEERPPIRTCEAVSWSGLYTTRRLILWLLRLWSQGEKDMKEIRYDKDVDALIIVFSDEKIAYEEEVDGLIVGFSASKEPVWFEILDASKSFLPKILQKISESGVSVSVG